jgi:hypothetical protein
LARRLPGLLLGTAALLFSVLLAMRVFMPEAVVKTKLGFALNFAWVFVLFWALGEWKGLSIGRKGVAGLVLLSMLPAVFLADYILDLRYFADALSGRNDRVFLLGAWGAVAGWAWWLILHEKKAASLAIAALIAVAVIYGFLK